MGANVNLTIVGLGVISTSVGLALKGATSAIQITGHDPDPVRLERAKKLGAIDKSHWNLIAACENADLILVELTWAEFEKTLTALSAELKPGALVVDLLPIKAPVMELAQKVLPATAHFIGGHIVSPALACGDLQPSVELLKGATFYLVAPPTAGGQAVERASALAESLGTSPCYVDAIEHDGLVAATSLLPLLGCLAMIDVIAQGGGWEDRKHCVCAELGHLALTLLHAPVDWPQLLAFQRELIVGWMQEYIEALTTLRRLLIAGDMSSVSKSLEQVSRICEELLRVGPPAPPSSADSGAMRGLRDMFLGSLGHPGKR
jgi:prephenate dehydrogenase